MALGLLICDDFSWLAATERRMKRGTNSNDPSRWRARARALVDHTGDGCGHRYEGHAAFISLILLMTYRCGDGRRSTDVQSHGGLRTYRSERGST